MRNEIIIKVNSREALNVWLTTGENWKLPNAKGVRLVVSVEGRAFNLDCPGLYRTLDAMASK